MLSRFPILDVYPLARINLDSLWRRLRCEVIVRRVSPRPIKSSRAQFFVAGQRWAVISETYFTDNWSEICRRLGAAAATFDAEAFCVVDESRRNEGGLLPELITKHLGDLANERIHARRRTVSFGVFILRHDSKMRFILITFPVTNGMRGRPDAAAHMLCSWGCAYGPWRMRC